MGGSERNEKEYYFGRKRRRQNVYESTNKFVMRDFSTEQNRMIGKPANIKHTWNWIR